MVGLQVLVPRLLCFQPSGTVTVRFWMYVQCHISFGNNMDTYEYFKHLELRHPHRHFLLCHCCRLRQHHQYAILDNPERCSGLCSIDCALNVYTWVISRLDSYYAGAQS